MKFPETVLVTGAASGIGYATASRLAELGSQVIAVDLDSDGLARLCRCAGAERVRAMSCDLTDQQAAANLFRQAHQIGYQGAVNCAGIEGTIGLLLDQTPDDLGRIVGVNVTATLNALRDQLKHLVTQGCGSVVNLASIYALRGQPRWVAYSATKAAIIGATQGAALEVAQHRVRVNAVAPGPIETPLLIRSTQGDLARTAAMVPLKRNGRPDEVADAILWLLSDASAFVSGAVLSVDGGMAAQVVAQPILSAAGSFTPSRRQDA